MGAGGYVIGRALLHPSERVTQPIAFNHKKHTTDLEIECGTCHEFYAEGSHAGLPMLSICMGCHEAEETGSPEMKKIREMAGQKQNDVFRKLFRMPDHVFYSHRRHAGIAKLPCETCHGGIALTTSPPDRPLVRITMNFCIDCHRQRKVSTDCTGCHR
jgi:hypothetical protein